MAAEAAGTAAAGMAAEGVVHTATTLSKGGTCKIKVLAGSMSAKLMTLLKLSNHPLYMHGSMFYDFWMHDLETVRFGVCATIRGVAEV